MSTVPFTFATSTIPIPLSELDANFATIYALSSNLTVTSNVTTTYTVTPNFTAGNNSLKVYVNGSKQIIGLNYTEASDGTSVTFSSSLNVGDIIEFTG